MTKISRQAQISEDLAGQRLDQAAHALFSDFSRSRIQQWIKDGSLTVNKQTAVKNKQKVTGNELLHIETEVDAHDQWQAECVPLHIVYEDNAIMLINKQDQLVMHPAAGNYSGTLLNGLIYHNPNLTRLPRAGIVHRLDKDTTGLLVVAKTLEAYTFLVDQLQRRLVSREYDALVNGQLISGGTIDKAISRDPRNRLKFCCHPEGKTAVSHYKIINRYRGITHISVKLETGRTHQIRVHCSEEGFPIVGDVLYGGRKYTGQSTEATRNALINFPRQALHARKLGLIHPETRKYLNWEIDLPEDMAELIAGLTRQTGVLFSSGQ